MTFVDRPAADQQTRFLPGERETFLAAIERRRKASWRVTAACSVAVVALTIVVAILMSPLLYCAIGLGLDVANLMTPAPDLLLWAGRQVDAVASARIVSAPMVIRLAVLAMLPGLALMAAAAYALRRVWDRSPLFNLGQVPGREPDRTVLAEQRLANVVDEMAIAAGIPVPRIVIVPGGVNAAACGRDESHVTLLVGEALPAGATREHLEGMIGHLTASIVDGDMAIGLRVTTTLSLFGLIARVGSAFTDRHAIAYTASLWRVFVAPTSANTLALLGTLTDPFAETDRRERQVRSVAAPSNDLTWRDWLMMPVMGPLVLTGFLSGLVCQFFLEPLVAWAWRERKYMADATAVQLTRDPDALAGALAAIEHSPTGIAPWTAHLAVAGTARGGSGPFGESIVPIFPSPEKRVAALRRMGAHVAMTPRPAMPKAIVAVFAVLLSIGAALMSIVAVLLVMVSTAISGLFTVFPAGLIHVLLRWVGTRR
jgi:Zn-dependent protease with chaperone function